MPLLRPGVRDIPGTRLGAAPVARLHAYPAWGRRTWPRSCPRPRPCPAPGPRGTAP